MQRVARWIEGFAIAWGGPGLFVIGFLDSSFLSFPEVNDFLVILMVSRHHERLLYYTVMATLGSLGGCLLLYYLARKSGETFVRRWFKEHHVERGLRLFQKYGLLVVIVPALLPPPAPFKIFVLLAGVAGVPAWQFTVAVFVARGIRYGGEGLLAVRYGDRAASYLKAHATEAGLWLSGIALALGLVWAWFNRRRASRAAGKRV